MSAEEIELEMIPFMSFSRSYTTKAYPWWAFFFLSDVVSLTSVIYDDVNGCYQQKT